jgi:hypothetical protein
MNELEELAKQEVNFNTECDEILSQSNKLEVQLEVVWAAFKHKEQFPKASLLECLQVGADEWGV